MKFYLLLLFIIVSTFCYAGKITGKTTDDKTQPLAFTSILVKGTLKGTSANASGEYSLILPAGAYVLVAQHVGYKTVEQKVNIASDDIEVNFQLPEQQYDLGNVVIKKGEDAAYGIIRNAIAKRKYYEEEVKKFETEVYIKGQLKMRNHPRSFMGEKVDFEDGDTSKRKMLFLSETVAKYYVNLPNTKVEVLSTKVSGNSDGFGFSSPQIFSFYQNNIRLANLNPRGFVSPIASNAFSFYKYKLEGTFFENGQMVNRIKVIPKSTYEPTFNGYINIIENEWRIHSVQLMLLKENQMQFVDTLRIEQLYAPVGKVWVIKQQTIIPAIKIFGFDMHGSFVQVYDKFNLNPHFAKGFFDHTVMKFYDSANKKPPTYWDTIRPIPLLTEEVQDYKKKDSLELRRKDPHYMDSLDRVRNKPNVMQLITTGQTFSSERSRTSVDVDGVLDIVNYNTVEGLVLNFSPTFTKRLNVLGTRRFSISPTVRYGFSNKRFNSHLTGSYTFGKKYFTTITLSGGRRVFQFNNDNPVPPRNNTVSSLLWERNYLKIYEAAFWRGAIRKGFSNGLTAGVAVQFQDRSGLQNTTDYKWRDFPEREFTPNISLQHHSALQSTIMVTWQPAARYIEMPDRKINIGSKYPTLSLSYTHGIHGLFGSDVDYSKWRVGVNDNLNLKLYGRFSYRVGAGGFIHNKSSFLPDYQHFMGNQSGALAPLLQSFQLLRYYALSNTEKFYSTAHVEYHLNGFITNKIPLFKKFNWFVVTGSNLLYLQNGTTYGEAFIGVENIFKVLRLDYIQSFGKNTGFNTSGIRFSLPVVLRGEIE
jgi:hypothetical protein